MSDSSEKACPFCAELIKSEAIKCKHCQSFLVPPAPRSSEPGSRWEVLIVIAILSIPFVIGGIGLLWYNNLPAAERARFERQMQ